MGGRAQRAQTKKARKTPSDQTRKYIADLMMDLVTRWVAKELTQARPQVMPTSDIEAWSEYKELERRLGRLLDQTVFIAEIVRGER